MGIYNAVKHNTRVLSINLYNTDISAEEAKHIGDLLKTNKTLKSIDYAWSKIADAGVQHICEALKVNKTLKSIHLSWNQITDAGVQHLCDLLKTNKTLKSIDLSHNQITDAGVQHICEALKINATLQSIELRCNQITDAGVQHLCDLLKTNTTLQSIELYGNQITDAGVQHICEALQNNKTLQSIELSWNLISYAGVQAFETAIKTNSNILCAYYHSQSPEIISLLQERGNKIKNLINRWKANKHSIHHSRYSEILEHKESMIFLALREKLMSAAEIAELEAFAKQAKKTLPQIICSQHKQDLFALLNPDACNEILGFLSVADQNALQDALSTSASVNSNAVNEIVQNNIAILPAEIIDEKVNDNPLTFYNAALFIGFVCLNIIAYKGFVFAFEKAATVCVPNVDLDTIKIHADLSYGAIYSCIFFTIVVAWLEYRGICREISI
ncbi:MAG: hypothetical protein ACK5WS_00480 [Alphaproteobacteria bacterium]